LKICLLSRFFDLKTNSGIGRVGIEVRDRLIKRGYEVITLQVSSESHLRYLKYTAWDLRHLPKADIYHSITPMESIYLPKDKSVATILDLIPILYPEKSGARMNLNPINRFLGSKYFQFGVKQAVKCKHVVTISDETKNELVVFFNISKDKISVLYPGIREDLKPKPKPDNVFRIGYLGQLDHRKRVDLLIKAFTKTDIDGELVIAGTGADKEALSSLANNDKRIKFLGFVPDDKIVDFYNSLDLFCFPTAVEGFGLPIIEAMACKKPILTLRDSIIPKVVKDMTYEALNLGQMLQNLYDSWDITGWRNYAAPNKVSSNYSFSKYFTWDRYVDGLENIFKEVASGK
jgi:glycosyltransferase involved in cell wall biosynthesis